MVERSQISCVPLLVGVEAFEAHFTRFSYARHSHESYAVGTIDAGAMHFWHQGTTCTVTPNGIIAINPGEVHDGRPAVDKGCRYRMIYIDRETIDRSLESDIQRIGQIFSLRGPTFQDLPLACGIRRLHQAIERANVDAIEILELQTVLMQVLHRFFANHGQHAVPVTSDGRENPAIKRAKDYLAEHIGAAVTLNALAQEVGLSPFYFLRAFKRATGMPPHHYANQLRLERSRAILRSGESLAGTAVMLGFVDQSHFSRRFKAAFGITPGQYAAAACPRSVSPVH